MMKVHTMALAVAAVAAVSFGEGRPDLVKRVKRGELAEAKASWWGFDNVDATAALQAAVRSGVPRLIVDNPGRPWIVRPIHLESNQTVVFEDGVVVEAKKGEFKGKNDSLFSINQKQNVALRGPGATLRMQRSDYDNPELYTKAEWRHVLSIRSSKNVEVHGLTLALSGGDGIYLGVSKRGTPDENIVIKDVVCDRNYRQGISVIAARNLLIENTVMKDTRGTPPSAGIDFEPNHPAEELVNCVMRNCVSENNAGSGYTFYLPNLNAGSAPISVRLENCESRGNARTDFGFTTGNSEREAVGGHIDVVNCRFKKCATSAIHIRRKPVAGVAVRFEGCTIDSPAGNDPSVIPIVLQSRTGNERSIGGVDFGELILIDPLDRPFLNYDDWSGGLGVESIAGTIHLRRDGVSQEHRLTKEWLEKIFPPRVYRPIPRLSVEGFSLIPAGVPGKVGAVTSAPAFLRRAGVLVFSAQAGETVSLTLEHAQVGRYGGNPLDVYAVTPSGKRTRMGVVAFKERATVELRARESGVYRVPLDVNPNKVALVSSSHPVALSGEDGPVHFIRAAGDLFFLVPAGTREFGVLVYGEGRGEAVKAAVFDPAGGKVWEKDRITLPEMFAPDRPAPDRDEVWRLRLSKPTGITCEDNYIDLRGIPPFLARDARALLKVRE